MADINYDKYITSKGLKILNFYDKTTKRVGIQYVTKASTSINPKGKEGLAHFVEHLVSKQSKKYPSVIKLGTVMENIGAAKSASTSHYNTRFSINGGASDFDLLLDINSDLVQNPHITNKSFNSERLVIEQEIVRTGAMNARLARDTSWKILYSDSPIAGTNLGNKNSLSGISIKDAESFIKKNYLNKNSIVVIWGGVSSDEVFRKVEKAYSSLSNDNWSDPVFEFERKDPIIISSKKSNEISIVLSFRLPKDYDLSYAASLSRIMLCSGWASRFPQRLRVKEGLIYNWSSSSSTEQDTASIDFHLSTSKQTFEQLLKSVGDEIIKFKSKKISKSELKRAKNYKLKPLSWSFERAGELASWYLGQELYRPDEIETPEQSIRRVKSISQSDIYDFSQKYLTSDNWYLSVVGDVSQEAKSKLQDLLQFE